MSRAAVFFDRDDTLLRDVPYNGDPERVELLPGAAAALLRLRDAGFLLFVISNQSGVGRGYITAMDVEAVNREMERQLGASFFTAIYSCYAAPGEVDNNCRKPNPGMVWQARDEHDLDLAASWFVGDKASDMECARNAGCHAVLLQPPHRGGPAAVAPPITAEYTASSLLEAAQWIISQQQGAVKPGQSSHQERDQIMIARNQVYRCGVCGNMVEVVAVGGGTLVCCGQQMTHQVENTSDGATEKHVPVVVVEGQNVKVTVGSVVHPMLENHYIQWIEVVTASKVLRKYLAPGAEPVATFIVDEPVLQVREYCNLHGLWSA